MSLFDRLHESLSDSDMEVLSDVRLWGGDRAFVGAEVIGASGATLTRLVKAGYLTSYGTSVGGKKPGYGRRKGPRQYKLTDKGIAALPAPKPVTKKKKKAKR